MSNYHLIPTFSFAPRHHHQQHAQQEYHPFRLFELMDRVFEPELGVGGQRLVPRRRGFGELHFGEDPSKFELLFDLGEQFKPEDVEVNVKLVDDALLHIEARHETGSVESGEYRNHFFSKTVTLPEGTDIENLKSTLSDHGVLKVEAPRKAIEAPKPAVREIPIQKMSSPAVKDKGAASK